MGQSDFQSKEYLAANLDCKRPLKDIRSMAVYQNIGKLHSEVVPNVVIIYFSYLFSIVFNSECPAWPEPKRRFLR